MRRNDKAEWELWSAVRLLAHWSDNIKKRLANAYVFHLCYLQEEDMPTKELKKKLINAQKRLTKNHTKSVEDAIYHWPLKSCRSIADDICWLYYGFTHFEWHLHPEESLLESLVGKMAPSNESKHQE